MIIFKLVLSIGTLRGATDCDFAWATMHFALKKKNISVECYFSFITIYKAGGQTELKWNKVSLNAENINWIIQWIIDLIYSHTKIQ